MDIGTAKPSAAERRRVPHHLIDLVAPDTPFTVADWTARARALLPEIASRGRLPVIVGGTGLYVTALLDGFDFGVQAWSPKTRRRLAAELEGLGLAPLARRLTALAPRIAAATDLHNPRRVLRALERAELGDTAPPRARPIPGPLTIIALQRPREVLAGRIEQRAKRMFARGLLDETQRLLDAGYPVSLPSMSGHGYAEAVALLAASLSRDDAVAATTRRTRQYAKRQLSWFGRDSRITWLPAGEGADGDPSLVQAALHLLR